MAKGQLIVTERNTPVSFYPDTIFYLRGIGDLELAETKYRFAFPRKKGKTGSAVRSLFATVYL